jgi:hypothetical protein
VTDADLRREAERLLWRYVVEVVERFSLCPWARRARERGEIRVEVLTGAAIDPAEVAAAVAACSAGPMGMVVLPRARPDPAALRRLRDQLLAARPPVGIADFHPEAELDLGAPARAVPGLRRAPDPMLQVVRLDVLAAARAAPPPPGLAGQAAILAGRAAPPPIAVSEQIAADNLATARAEAAALAAAIAAIHADRDRTYGAVPLTDSTR